MLYTASIVNVKESYRLFDWFRVPPFYDGDDDDAAALQAFYEFVASPRNLEMRMSGKTINQQYFQQESNQMIEENNFIIHQSRGETVYYYGVLCSR